MVEANMEEANTVEEASMVDDPTALEEAPMEEALLEEVPNTTTFSCTELARDQVSEEPQLAESWSTADPTTLLDPLS